MHQNPLLIQNRVRRVLLERVKESVYTPVAELDLTAWHVGAGRGEPVPPALALPGADPAAAREAGVEYVPFGIGDAWGPAWGTTWFHLTGTIPAAAAGEPVELVIDLGWADSVPGFQSEGLVYRPDGTVVKALNPFNRWVRVTDRAAGGERIDLYVEAAANPLLLQAHPFLPTEEGDRATSSTDMLYTVARADINVFNAEVWELVQDIEVLFGLQAELSLEDPRRWNILYALDRSMDRLDLDDVVGSAAAARAALAPELARPATASAHQITAIGHAHIDSAWLWPVRETIRKVARTSSNVLNLLATHPDLQFAMSSAQQYEWLRDFRPEVFAGVRDAVAEGRFLPVGGMWVESDTLMVGSEAMARQFVHGQRFFRENFGRQCREVWLPDSFGYSASLPQIATLAGMEWFLTQKISWNQVNKFPHHTFAWEGIDGTRIFTHFPPVDTYLSELSGKELAHAVRNFADKGAANHSLVPFGWGDGGGGPTREMVARARRTADLEGSPQVRIRPPADFFADAQAEYADPPVWKGELYLELHRGTLTSQARTKQGNRRNEHLLREAELWNATAAARGLLPYPYEELDRLWKQVLLLQFHDILPGSAIAWVHREAVQEHAAITTALEALIDAAQDALTGDSTSGVSTGSTTGAGSTTEVLFNASPYPRYGVPSLAAAVPIFPTGTATIEQDGGNVVVRNGRLRVVFGADGVICSIRDLAADREVVPPGQGANLLQLHADFPNMWDAWDVDAFYRNTVTDLRAVDSLSAEVEEDGVAVVTVRRSFGKSSIIQRISMAPGSARIDVANTIDWHEQEKLLKVAFPIDVHSDEAAYETQYGHVRRATHENTSWEAARFEVCAHRWVHVAERSYGAAVANDSSYGHDATRHPRPGGGSYTVLRLSLLRGPRFPDPRTDQGPHELRYALVVGAGLAEAIEAGYDLNLPSRPRPGSAVAPLVAVEGSTVLVEAVKLADDRSGDVIVRLYEPVGARAAGTLRPSFPLAGVLEANLLEAEYDGGAVTSWDEGGVALALRPFQIVTLRLRSPERKAGGAFRRGGAL